MWEIARHAAQRVIGEVVQGGVELVTHLGDIGVGLSHEDRDALGTTGQLREDPGVERFRRPGLS